jgi:hypothetical protein
MATKAKKSTAAPKRKAPTPKVSAKKVKVSAVEQPTKATVSAVRMAMTELMVKQPGISTEELSSKLSAAGYSLSPATCRTMSYHCGATIKSLVALNLITLPE